MKFVANNSYWIAWRVYLTTIRYLILLVLFIITDKGFDGLYLIISTHLLIATSYLTLIKIS